MAFYFSTLDMKWDHDSEIEVLTLRFNLSLCLDSHQLNFVGLATIYIIYSYTDIHGSQMMYQIAWLFPFAPAATTNVNLSFEMFEQMNRC